MSSSTHTAAGCGESRRGQRSSAHEDDQESLTCRPIRGIQRESESPQHFAKKTIIRGLSRATGEKMTDTREYPQYFVQKIGGFSQPIDPFQKNRAGRGARGPRRRAQRGADYHVWGSRAAKLSQSPPQKKKVESRKALLKAIFGWANRVAPHPAPHQVKSAVGGDHLCYIFLGGCHIPKKRVETRRKAKRERSTG